MEAITATTYAYVYPRSDTVWLDQLSVSSPAHLSHPKTAFSAPYTLPKESSGTTWKSPDPRRANTHRASRIE